MRHYLNFMTKYALVSYDRLADEYYDSVRHPTCANFRAASKILLNSQIELIEPNKKVCEVGCGMSEVAEILHDSKKRVDHLFLLDESIRMLSYSFRWANKGARLLQGNSMALPFQLKSLDAIVASLGDPYNEPKFWGELERVLKPGGAVLFTTPSYEWKTKFREDNMQDFAEFILKNSEHVITRSWIFDEESQIQTIERAGFLVEKIDAVKANTLTETNLSPKIIDVAKQNGDIVKIYVARKK